MKAFLKSIAMAVLLVSAWRFFAEVCARYLETDSDEVMLAIVSAAVAFNISWRSFNRDRSNK